VSGFFFEMIEIRKGFASDIPQLLELIKELAEFENSLHHVELDETQLIQYFSEDRPLFEFELAVSDEQVVGFALYFYTFSTWQGKCIYLEDLYVKQDYRRNGIGSLLFDRILEIANLNHCKRVNWQVLDWNYKAIGFYSKYESIQLDEWKNFRIVLEK